MHIDGEKAYASRLDSIKLIAFLREQGMSQAEIASLHIHFVKRIRERWRKKTWYGSYSYRAGRHAITLATWMLPGKLSSYTTSSQQEVLYELNETLMYEMQHALDRGNRKAQVLSLLISAICITIPIFLDWLLLRGTLWFWLPFILILIVGPRFAYQYSFLERRARAFEQTYGRSYLLFRW